MALSSNFVQFIRDWTTKAESIQLRDHDLASYFDKFFTLFVIYNRLYTEATFTLWRDGRVEPPDPDRLFPDSKAAKFYVGQFLHGPTMLNSLEAESESRSAIREMEHILEDGHFFVLLRGLEAEGCRENDEDLLERLRSPRPWKRAEAVLEFVHAIRCNTFHGSKEFDRVQIQVLKPCIAVVAHLNRLLFDKLQSDDERTA
jgi:hypothetical protein